MSLCDRPLINAWTEWGTLRKVVVGRVEGAAYPEYDPFCPYNYVHDDHLSQYLSCQGPRPPHRIRQAAAELDNLCEILEGESIQVSTVEEFDEDVRLNFERKRCQRDSDPSPRGDPSVSNAADIEKTIAKQSMQIVRPSEQRFDHLVSTPFFKNYYQFCIACPRDSMITLGNTVVESATPARARYFESSYLREVVYPLWKVDRRIQWRVAPKPTCADSMFDDLSLWKKGDEEIERRWLNGYQSAINETEICFEAADMMRFGKDVFYKKSPSANNLGIEWLRREFPDLRFHMMHFPTDHGIHMDDNLIPLRPPSSGSSGILLINRNYPPLQEELKIFRDNDWDIYFGSLPRTNEVSPIAVCSPNVNMNLLSISEKCIVIEECELPLYHLLEDLGFDVVTVPFRTLNEFGGGIHCCTWDLVRDDSCVDYLPHQDYEAELSMDLSTFSDTKFVDPALYAPGDKVKY